jgi:hypothetical protein
VLTSSGWAMPAAPGLRDGTKSHRPVVIELERRNDGSTVVTRFGDPSGGIGSPGISSPIERGGQQQPAVPTPDHGPPGAPFGGAPAGPPQPGGPAGSPQPGGPTGLPQPGGPTGLPQPGGPAGLPQPGGPTGLPQPGGPTGLPQPGGSFGRGGPGR